MFRYCDKKTVPWSMYILAVMCVIKSAICSSWYKLNILSSSTSTRDFKLHRQGYKSSLRDRAELEEEEEAEMIAICSSHNWNDVSMILLPSTVVMMLEDASAAALTG